MPDIDDIMADWEEEENGPSKRQTASKESLDDLLMGSEEDATAKEGPDENDGKVHIGSVDRFFSKLKVAAINLTGSVKVGDMIEISGEGKRPMRLKVSSMQIDREDVEEASDGDSIGIKVSRPVSAGSKVYLLTK